MKDKIIESKPNKKSFIPDGYGDMYGVAYYGDGSFVEQDFSNEPYILDTWRTENIRHVYPNLIVQGTPLRLEDNHFLYRFHSKEYLKKHSYIKHSKSKGVNIKVIADNRDDAYKTTKKMLAEFIQNETEKKKEIETRISNAMDVLNKLESN